MQRRFIPWTNNLEKKDAEIPKIADSKQIVKRIEFKGNDKVEKSYECRIIHSKKLRVTQDYLKRREKPTNESFGTGSAIDEIRLNVGLTQIQRDNIWHPYYEIKLEEEDLASKFRKKIDQNREKQVDGAAIEDLQAKISQLDAVERAQKEKADAEASGIKAPKKKTLDMAAITRNLQAKDAEQAQVKQDDPYAVKLTNIANNHTEEEIEEVMSRFGRVQKARIPIDMNRNRPYGFAIVRFEKIESA